MKILGFSEFFIFLTFIFCFAKRISGNTAYKMILMMISVTSCREFSSSFAQSPVDDSSSVRPNAYASLENLPKGRCNFIWTVGRTKSYKNHKLFCSIFFIRFCITRFIAMINSTERFHTMYKTMNHFNGPIRMIY